MLLLHKAIIEYPEHGEFYLRLKEHCYNAKRELDKVNSKNNSCYIATACYGSYDCTQVLTFRKFRDMYLCKNIVGKIFINAYYKLSPSLAKRLENKYIINKIIRKILLEPIHYYLKNKYK